MSTDEVLRHFGTWVAAAKALGIKPPSVSEWVASGKIPIGRQYQIEVVTQGALRAELPLAKPTSSSVGAQ